MLNSLLLGAALIAVLATPVTSTLLASPANAANQWAEASKSKLLMTSEESKAITGITNAKTPILIAGSSTDTWGASARVVVYNLNYDGRKFTGQVLNRTGKKVSYVKLNYEAVNGQGQLIDKGTVYVTEVTLSDSQNGTFLGSTQLLGTNLIIKSAEWLGD